MKRVGVLLLGLSLVLLAAGVGHSGGEKKDDKVKGQLPSGWKKLNLSKEQVLKVYSVQTAFRTKIQALEEQVKKLKAEEFKEQLAILTEEQKKALIGEETPKKKDEKKKDEKK